MERTTIKDLKRRIDYLNKLVGAPLEMWKRDEDGELVRNERGNLVADLRTYTLSQANGGVQLERSAESYVVIPRCTRRELYHRMNAFIEGLEAGKDLNQ